MSLADVELKDYEKDLTVVFQEKTYPVFVLMEKLLKITDKNGNCVPFILNEQQIELYKDICKQRRMEKPVRENILKSRQIGYSTFIAGLFFIIGIFTPNIKVGVVADVEKHAKDIFSKYEYFYNHLDDNNPNLEIIKEYAQKNKGKRHYLSYKPALKAQRGSQLMQTAYGNSTIEVVVAGESSGRSNTYHLLHLSECAFFKDLMITLNGLLETVSSKNKNSFIFLETTANGFNEYKERWDKDVLGKTSYNAVFMPWFKSKEYIDEKYLDERLKLPYIEEWLLDKQEKYHLNNAQIMWYWNKYLDKGDKSLTLQEYPFCPTDAFVTSGHCIFDTELIAQRKNDLFPYIHEVKQGFFSTIARYSQDGSMIDLQNYGFLPSRNGAIKIFKEPIEGHPYIANCDPAMGGSDFYVIQVIDNYTLEQVATYRSNNPKGDDEVAFQLVSLGYYYNTALISAETNNSNGTYILQTANKCGYPFIYQDNDYESLQDVYANRFGYKTTQKNKNPMVSLFKMAFRDNFRMINDYETLIEMEEFEVVKNLNTQRETFKANGSSHDDLVMAMCGCLYVREARVQDFLPQIVNTEHEKDKNSFFDYARKIKHKQEQNKGVFIKW